VAPPGSDRLDLQELREASSWPDLAKPQEGPSPWPSAGSGHGSPVCRPTCPGLDGAAYLGRRCLQRAPNLQQFAAEGLNLRHLGGRLICPSPGKTRPKEAGCPLEPSGQAVAPPPHHAQIEALPFPFTLGATPEPEAAKNTGLPAG